MDRYEIAEKRQKTRKTVIAIPSAMEYIISAPYRSDRTLHVITFAYQEVFSAMLSYSRQVVICGSVRKTLEQTIAQSSDIGLRAKISGIPTTESVLRAVSLFPNINTEEELKDFIIKHIVSSLRLTESQREYLHLNS